jgi:hypothetical protein
MGETVERLNGHILSFLDREIDGAEFEKMFSDCYDFEEIDEGVYSKYFEEIRTLLERFSPNVRDLQENSDYFISEEELRIKIKRLISNRPTTKKRQRITIIQYLCIFH